MEDTACWGLRDKDLLYRDLLDAVDGAAAPERFVERIAALGAPDAQELELVCGLPRVLAVLATCAPGLQQCTRDWVSELTRGMAVYSRRRVGADGISCLISEADLERYCYFVAGSIGHLLTEAFLHEVSVSPLQMQKMRRHAEQFGAGLQLVNILRDICEDLERNVCFIPRTLLAQHGLTPAQLADKRNEPAARVALQPLFDQARSHLDAAFQYVLAIPATAPEMRNFCLIPLWLAVATLAQCRRDPELFVPGKRVKIDRARAMSLIQQCTGASSDDAALRRYYANIEPPVEAA